MSSRIAQVEQTLQDLRGQLDKVLARDREKELLEEKIAEAREAKTKLKAEAKAKEVETKIRALRKEESEHLTAWASSVVALEAQTVRLGAIQDELDHVRSGSSIRRAVCPALLTALRQQVSWWESRCPDLLGNPDLPTVGEIRVTEARHTLENAERNKREFEARIKETGQLQTAEIQRRQEDLKAGIAHAKQVLKWAEKHQKERRPSTPRPAYQTPKDQLVTIRPDDTTNTGSGFFA